MNWIPSIIAALVAVAGVFTDPVQGWIAAHPAVAAVLAGVATLIASLLKSPVNK